MSKERQERGTWIDTVPESLRCLMYAHASGLRTLDMRQATACGRLPLPTSDYYFHHPNTVLLSFSPIFAHCTIIKAGTACTRPSRPERDSVRQPARPRGR